LTFFDKQVSLNKKMASDLQAGNVDKYVNKSRQTKDFRLYRSYIGDTCRLLAGESI
jgi:hypothetical protein